VSATWVFGSSITTVVCAAALAGMRNRHDATAAAPIVRTPIFKPRLIMFPFEFVMVGMSPLPAIPVVFRCESQLNGPPRDGANKRPIPVNRYSFYDCVPRRFRKVEWGSPLRLFYL
jgi:hypothetical protein